MTQRLRVDEVYQNPQLFENFRIFYGNTEISGIAKTEDGYFVYAIIDQRQLNGIEANGSHYVTVQKVLTRMVSDMRSLLKYWAEEEVEVSVDTVLKIALDIMPEDWYFDIEWKRHETRCRILSTERSPFMTWTAKNIGNAIAEAVYRTIDWEALELEEKKNA